MAYAVLQAVAVRLEREARLRGPLPATFAPSGRTCRRGDGRAGRATAAAKPARGGLSAAGGRVTERGARRLHAESPCARGTRRCPDRAAPRPPRAARPARRRRRRPRPTRAPPRARPARPCSACRSRRQHVDRSVHGFDHVTNVLRGAQPGREQHVGAGLLVGLQARDRVGQVLAAADVVLGPRGEHHPDRPRVRDLGGGDDALAGEAPARRWVADAARVVLDRAARPGRCPGERRSSRPRRRARRRTRSRGRPTPAGRCRRTARRRGPGPRRG